MKEATKTVRRALLALTAAGAVTITGCETPVAPSPSQRGVPTSFSVRTVSYTSSGKASSSTATGVFTFGAKGVANGEVRSETAPVAITRVPSDANGDAVMKSASSNPVKHLVSRVVSSFRKDGDLYTMVAADSVGSAVSKRPQHIMLLKNGKLRQHTELTYDRASRDSQPISAHVTAFDDAGKRLRVRDYDFSNARTGEQQEDLMMVAQRLVARAALVLMPRTLYAQITTHVFNPIACAIDWAFVLTSLGSYAEFNVIADALGFNFALQMMVDCGTVTEGGVADPGAHLLPGNGVAYVCDTVTWYTDYYSDGVFLGETSFETRVCGYRQYDM